MQLYPVWKSFAQIMKGISKCRLGLRKRISCSSHSISNRRDHLQQLLEKFISGSPKSTLSCAFWQWFPQSLCMVNKFFSQLFSISYFLSTLVSCSYIVKYDELKSLGVFCLYCFSLWYCMTPFIKFCWRWAHSSSSAPFLIYFLCWTVCKEKVLPTFSTYLSDVLPVKPVSLYLKAWTTAENSYILQKSVSSSMKILFHSTEPDAIERLFDCSNKGTNAFITHCNNSVGYSNWFCWHLCVMPPKRTQQMKKVGFVQHTLLLGTEICFNLIS